MRYAQAIALATLLLAAAPARAGWQRTVFVDSGGQPATPPSLNLKSVGVGAGGKVWAVGGTQSTASFIVTSTDGFATARQDTSCAGITRLLNAVWVAADGSSVHAFGQANAHAAWNGTSWSCTNLTVPVALGSITVSGIAFSDSANGYLVGGSTAKPTLPMVVQYASGTLTDVSPSTLSFGAASLIARSSASGILDYAVGGRLYRHPQTTEFLNAANITSLFLLGDTGLVAAGNAANTRKLNAATSTAAAPSGALMDFEPVLGVTMAPNGFALAVGQASSSNTTEGAIAQSLDGGDNWRRIDLSGISPAVRVLRAVACWDENNCVAVGANDLSLTGGSGFAPELLVYANQAPTAVVTVNGQALPATVPDNAEVTLAATVTDPEGDPATLTWFGPTSVDGSHSASVTFTPTISCSAQNLPHALELTDGRKTTSPPIDVPVLITHAPRAPASPALSPPPSAGTYQWQVGGTYPLTASATRDCGRPVTYEFQVSGAVPAPFVAGASATFELPQAGCGGQDGTIHLQVTDSGDASLTVSRDFPVHLAEIVEAPDLALSSGTDVQVTYGTTLSVTAQVDRHCSGTDASLFTYAWSCDPANSSATVQFKNDGDPCGSEVPCRLTVTPKGPGLPAVLDFTVKLLGASNGQGKVQLKGLGDTVSLQPGESIDLEAQTDLFCAPVLSWTCSCSGAPMPPPSPGAAAKWTFANPNPNCTGGACTCQVTATGGGQTATDSVQLVLGQSHPPTVVSVSYDGPQEVQDGKSVAATVAASNACATEFTWAWSCSGTPAPTAPSATSVAFVHPGSNCADVPATCTARATPSNGPGSAGEGSLAATYLAVPQPPTGVHIASVGVTGARVVATAEALGPCPDQGNFMWTAWLESKKGEPPFTFTGQTLDHTFETCGQDTVHLEVRLATFSDSADRPIDGASGVPVVTLEGTTDLRKALLLGCERVEPLVVSPQASSLCGVSWHWTQVDGPALPTRVLPGGELERRARPRGARPGLGDRVDVRGRRHLARRCEQRRARPRPLRAAAVRRAGPRRRPAQRHRRRARPLHGQHLHRVRLGAPGGDGPAADAGGPGAHPRGEQGQRRARGRPGGGQRAGPCQPGQDDPAAGLRRAGHPGGREGADERDLLRATAGLGERRRGLAGRRPAARGRAARHLRRVPGWRPPAREVLLHLPELQLRGGGRRRRRLGRALRAGRGLVLVPSPAEPAVLGYRPCSRLESSRWGLRSPAC
ncbi:MAG: hypothetical protein QM765_02100 [Myxococcales bacterium]